MKKTINIITIISISLIIHISDNLLIAGEFKKIKDMDGHIVEIPVNPGRIASLHGPSYDKIIMLGEIDRIAILMSKKQTAWANRIFPQLVKMPAMKSYSNVDVEQLLDSRVDLVLYSYFPEQAKRMEAAGVKTACAFDWQDRPKNMKEFMDNFKRQVMFFGEILGSQAMKRAAKYCTYFDNKISSVLKVTSGIKDNKKPKVYYGGRSGNLFYTQGKNTVMQWYTELAGGIYVSGVLNENYPETNMEQMLSWDPDIIMVSGMYSSLDAVHENAHWNNMRAVKNGKAYLIPIGIFAWDFASSESILLGIYLAKLFHPDIFKDWNMVDEAKTFYSEIYNIKLSSEDVDRILRCLPPG